MINCKHTRLFCLYKDTEFDTWNPEFIADVTTHNNFKIFDRTKVNEVKMFVSMLSEGITPSKLKQTLTLLGFKFKKILSRKENELLGVETIEIFTLIFNQMKFDIKYYVINEERYIDMTKVGTIHSMCIRNNVSHYFTRLHEGVDYE